MAVILNAGNAPSLDDRCSKCESDIRFYIADLTYVKAEKDNYRDPGHPAFYVAKCPVCDNKMIFHEQPKKKIKKSTRPIPSTTRKD